MQITRIEKSCQVIQPTKVWVGEIGDYDTERDVLDFALAHAGETRSSLHGCRLSAPTDDGEIVVTMYKD